MQCVFEISEPIPCIANKIRAAVEPFLGSLQLVQHRPPQFQRTESTSKIKQGPDSGGLCVVEPICIPGWMHFFGAV
jgi:hypothetical protein